MPTTGNPQALPVRIGFDAKRAFHNQTGLGNFSRWLISSYAARHPDAEIYLFTPSIGQGFSEDFPLLPNYRLVKPGLLGGRIFGAFGTAFWRSFVSGFTVRKLKLKIYHGLTHELPFFLPKSPGFAAVLTVHDVIFRRLPSFYKLLDRIVYHLKLGAACRRANKIIAVSTQTKKDLVEFCYAETTKIDVIGQDCHPRFSTKTNSDGSNSAFNSEAKTLSKYGISRPYIISVGTLEERKNQAVIIRAVATLNKLTRAPQMVFVGKIRSSYQSQISEALTIGEFDLKEKPLFIPRAAPEEMPVLFREALCSIYASSYEGFGLPVLESLRCGTPVICARESCLPEVGGSAALYFDLQNPAMEIIEHIKKLIEHNGVRENLVQVGLDQSKLFQTDHLLEQLQTCYEDVLKGQ